MRDNGVSLGSASAEDPEIPGFALKCPLSIGADKDSPIHGSSEAGPARFAQFPSRCGPPRCLSASKLERPPSKTKPIQPSPVSKRRSDRHPYVRLRMTEEPSPRSGRWIVARGASRGNAAPAYQGAPAGAKENGSSPPCSARSSTNPAGLGTLRVTRIRSPRGFQQAAVSRFPPAGRQQQENGSNAPAGAGNRLAHQTSASRTRLLCR